MHLLNKDNLRIFISKNILNILFLCIIFSANKHIILSFNYIRGLLIDYSLFKFTPLHLLLPLLVLLYFSEFIKIKKRLLYLTLFIFINIFFSINPLFSLAYVTNYLPIFLITLLFVNTKSALSYKLIICANVFYILVFILQFFFKQSVFPYIPLGVYTYSGITANLDFFSFFGEKYVLPIGNFPHANVFSAFLCFLNIFHFKNKNYIFIFINTLLVLILSSLSSIIFLILLSLFFRNYWFTKVTSLLFIPIIYLFYLYGFKEVSITERLNQLNIFIFNIKNNLLFGVGINSFIPSINTAEQMEKRIYVLQPIHNIFLLFFSEVGLFTSTFIFYFLIIFKKYLKPSPYLLFILVFGSFDHFLITLSQGLLLLSLTIILHKSIINNNSHV